MQFFTFVLKEIITAPQDARKQEHKEQFRTSTLKFEAKGDSMKHLIYKWCLSVCLHFELSGTMEANNFVCPDCKNSNNWAAFTNQMLPVWYNANGRAQYHVPPKLSCLQEGEKRLIQQVAVYVPLQRLMHGQVGARGHIETIHRERNEQSI